MVLKSQSLILKSVISLFFLIVVLFFSACSMLETRPQKRVFQVHPAWVKMTTQVQNQRFRKINRMTPLLVNSLVVQGNAQDGVAAFRASDGQEIWRRPVPLGIEPEATEFKGRIYIAGNNGFISALNGKTGEEFWSFNTKAENLSRPLFDENEGVLYVLSSANVVYALEADSGKQKWIYSRQDTSSFSIRGGAQPVLKDGTLFVGFSDGSFAALNAKTGSVIWENQLNKNKKFRDIDATPVVDGDRLFVSGYDDRLYCLSAQKGEVLWRVDGGGYSPVLIQGGKIFYPSTTGQVTALNKENGEKIWSYSLKDGIATEIKAYKGLLVFGESQGRLLFLDPEKGQVLAGFEPGRGILAPPAVDEKNNRVYFISGEAQLYALDASWGWPSHFSYIP